MKLFISSHRLLSSAREILSVGVVVAFSLTAMAQTAHARLIFTTEEDGVNSDAYHLDIDDTSADFIDLNFGSAVTSQLRYDILNDKFIFTENVDFNGNEVQNFQIENLATAGEPTCDGTATGRMYYNTTNNDLLFCDGTVWTSTSSDLSGLAGAGLVVNGAALDVNVDDSTLEISTDTVQVKDAGITAAKLADGSVNGGTAGVITDDSITAADIAAGAVDTSELAADAVTTAEIAADTITAADIAAGAVDTSELAADAVTTAEIAADTILAGDIATGAVTTDEILDNTITATDIAASTITTAEIALDTITAADIATGAIGTLEIADGTVGTADLASGGNDKLLTTDGSGNVLWVDQAGLVLPTMTSGQMIVADGTGTPTAVTLSGDATVSNTGVVDLAANSVTTAEIAADTILAGDIATGAVTTDEILDNTITATDIAASTITTTEIAADTILAGDIATGAVTTDEILDNTVALIDIAERTASESVAPEYPNFTLNADGTNNNGRLESDHDGRNYYAWSTRKNTEQDYDIIWQWAVPENFQSWQANPILLDYKTDTAVAADNSIDITLLDTAGASDTLSAGTGLVSGTADTWVDDGIITASLAGTYTPGEYLTFRIKMKSRYGAGSRHPSYAGAFKLQYNVK